MSELTNKIAELEAKAAQFDGVYAFAILVLEEGTARLGSAEQQAEYLVSLINELRDRRAKDVESADEPVDTRVADNSNTVELNNLSSVSNWTENGFHPQLAILHCNYCNQPITDAKYDVTVGGNYHRRCPHWKPTAQMGIADDSLARTATGVANGVCTRCDSQFGGTPHTIIGGQLYCTASAPEKPPESATSAGKGNVDRNKPVLTGQCDWCEVNESFNNERDALRFMDNHRNCNAQNGLFGRKA